MPIKPVVTNIAVLRQKPGLIADGEDISMLIKDLEDTLEARKGYGLAAPQIGVKKQVAIVRYKDTKIDLINPVYLDKTGKYMYPQEGCLSFPGLRVDTDRWMQVIIEYGYPSERKKFLSVGAEAAVVQHETDHLLGFVIMDRKHKKR